MLTLEQAISNKIKLSNFYKIGLHEFYPDILDLTYDKIITFKEFGRLKGGVVYNLYRKIQLLQSRNSIPILPKDKMYQDFETIVSVFSIYSLRNLTTYDSIIGFTNIDCLYLDLVINDKIAFRIYNNNNRLMFPIPIHITNISKYNKVFLRFYNSEQKLIKYNKDTDHCFCYVITFGQGYEDLISNAQIIETFRHANKIYKLNYRGGFKITDKYGKECGPIICGGRENMHYLYEFIKNVKYDLKEINLLKMIRDYI